MMKPKSGDKGINSDLLSFIPLYLIQFVHNIVIFGMKGFK